MMVGDSINQSLGLPTSADAIAEMSGGLSGFYRGGPDLTPRETDVKIRDGQVQPTHGVSVYSNPARVERFGGAYRVVSLPLDLQIIQRGRDPEHYEITPRTPVTFEAYTDLLRQVPLAPYTGGRP